jgi:hypothetical protein
MTMLSRMAEGLLQSGKDGSIVTNKQAAHRPRFHI